ncbi:P-loop containing nucleoside triphosphate hydrolase protein [Conidiobolus coronatus NRRL 28638]|uniref:p-loop containing nucleoside triphosphate hydrolase protein n=1 Tax=Conidiobolus coronatus (strain ATCC 28846 / CBS 209.66 / NRRL 28638) TaxID=796925 RepID=A0A137PIZ5_CONC2|nr:P-loop containing nucleoside triphosphate hydrolase protein [Conidiobolus coronatus NRRL 28638]|eukprot:KXN74940.1 P-loop containing nucleoside triphosphate hydrolase protein [Conidiobolus coronatus NRRL 28638]
MHKKRNSPDDSDDEELASTSLFEPNGDSSQNASDKFAGTVKSLSLINFMSHKNTSLEFGTKINFITGRNGSGKSAILTAIITCLGGKVSFTNRANSFKSLIKEGESVAQITLEIRNSGPDAYKPEELGDIIIVERKIALDGKSGFRIKSADNRVYSSKKDELLAICDHFGIQVDNPLNVLTQDAARQFIGSTSSEDKYMMFLKGTQLSQLTDDHTLIKDAIISCESILKSKQAAIPQLHEEVKAARLKYYSMEKAQELHNNLENLKKQMAWAIVVEEEGRVKMAQDRVEKNQNRLPSIEEKISEIEVNVKKVDIKINDAKVQLEGLLEKKPLIQEEINSLQKTSQSKNEEKRKIENEQRHIDSNLKIERNKLENIEKKIREETEKSKKNIE